MQQVVQKLKISEFMSVCVTLAHNSGQIIRDVYNSQCLGKQIKTGEDDPVTMADIQAQTLIVEGLKKNWPTLRIIGEETQIHPGEVNLNLNHKLLPEKIFSQTNANLALSDTIDINDDVIVWVDPLDGTLSYVNGELDAVTTLIGLSIKSEPILGIIGYPFSGPLQSNGVHEYRSKVFFGRADQDKIFYAYGEQIENNQTFIPYDLPKPELKVSPPYSFCTSKNRLSPSIETQIKSLTSEEIIKIGGSGKKTLLVLQGEADMFIYVGLKMKRWDICAGDALLRSFGGSLLTLSGEKYTYKPENMQKVEEPYSIHNGVLATIQPLENIQEVIQITKYFL